MYLYKVHDIYTQRNCCSRPRVFSTNGAKESKQNVFPPHRVIVFLPFIPLSCFLHRHFDSHLEVDEDEVLARFMNAVSRFSP